MSESFNFERLQTHFRFLKETHGVDLTVPHGVGIDGKVYPATNKLITMGYSSTPSISVESRFYVPLENGLKVHASTYMGESTSHIHMQMHVPTIHINNDGTKMYTHGSALHIGEDAYHASFGENPNKTDEHYKRHPNPFYDEHMSLHSTRGPISIVHDVLKMWGKEPYQGTYDFSSQQGYQQFKKLRPNHDYEVDEYRPHLELTTDELTEHRQNFKNHSASASHNVAVYGVDTEHAFYNYNTKTEQLRPYMDVFGESFRKEPGN